MQEQQTTFVNYSRETEFTVPDLRELQRRQRAALLEYWILGPCLTLIEQSNNEDKRAYPHSFTHEWLVQQTALPQNMIPTMDEWDDDDGNGGGIPLITVLNRALKRRGFLLHATVIDRTRCVVTFTISRIPRQSHH